MASAWTQDGPIALPSRSLAYGAGVAVLVFALVGLGMGFQTAFRRSGAPELGAEAGAAGGKDDALIARPIVDLAPPAAAPAADKDDADDADDADAKADALAAQTAAAQADQANPAKAGDVDKVMASPSEKPPSLAKGPADESPPGTPAKSDVPF